MMARAAPAAARAAAPVDELEPEFARRHLLAVCGSAAPALRVVPDERRLGTSGRRERDSGAHEAHTITARRAANGSKIYRRNKSMP